MKRREVPEGIRFITFSCERRLPLLGHPGIRDVFVAAMAEAKLRFRFDLFAWVVMPEHVHILIRPRDGIPASRLLNFVKKSVAQRVITRWKRLKAPVLTAIVRDDESPRFWQKGGGFDRNVREAAEFAKEVRYIHRNPVERGLVANPEDWQWSSVRWWMGMRDGELECDSPPGKAGFWESWNGYK